MPFTQPNRYSPRPDWAQMLRQKSPPTGTWQFDLVVYWQWRATEHRPLEEAWADLKMRPTNAQSAIAASTADVTPTNDSGLIPPEIFGRVLARSKATTIDPNDNEAVILE